MHNPPVSDLRKLLQWAAERIGDYRERADRLPVAPSVELRRVRERLGGGPLPDEGLDASAVVDELAAAVEPALEYVSAFRAADLMIEQAAEPPFEQSFVEDMPDAAIRDAAREAVVGLPFALVWRVRKAS